jgi:hypothetical protein
VAVRTTATRFFFFVMFLCFYVYLWCGGTNLYKYISTKIHIVSLYMCVCACLCKIKAEKS